jgi:hypothetical protein
MHRNALLHILAGVEQRIALCEATASSVAKLKNECQSWTRLTLE